MKVHFEKSDHVPLSSTETVQYQNKEKMIMCIVPLYFVVSWRGCIHQIVVKFLSTTTATFINTTEIAKIQEKNHVNGTILCPQEASRVKPFEVQ